MSWPQWPTAQPPVLPVQATAAPVINSAPAVAPPGLQYTPEQWAQAQQQNWHQWAQWQQQYQQWHQQYGAEYQKSMNALAAQSQAPVPALPNMAVPPPLPAEPKPPLPDEPPPGYNSAPGYNTSAPAPPPPQPPIPNVNPQTAIGDRRPPVMYQKPPPNWQQNYPIKRGYDQHEPEAKRQMVNKPDWGRQAPPPQKRESLEELTEAEKKFDKQFADWEAQFNKWKEQNAEHPDKEQYREYEKKWESWRNQLLERREQMKRKRLAMLDNSNKNRNYNSPQNNFNQPPPNFSSHGAPKTVTPPNYSTQVPPKTATPLAPVAAAPAPFASSPSLPVSKPPPTLNDEPLVFKNRNEPPVEENVGDFIKPNTDGGIPGLDLVKDDPSKPKDEEVVLVELEKEKEKEKKGADLEALSKGINSILGDQKILNMLSLVSQNQMPKPDDNLTTTVSKIGEHDSGQYYEQSNMSNEEHSNHSANFGQREVINNFDDQTRSSFTMHPEQETRLEPGGFNRNQFGLKEDKFGPGANFGSGPARDRFGPGPAGDRFGSGPAGDRFGPGFTDDRFGPGPGGDRFGPGPGGDRFGPGPGGNRFVPGPAGDKFGAGPALDKFGSGPTGDKFGPGPAADKFGPGPAGDKFGLGKGEDRFAPASDKFGSGPGKFGPGLSGDKFASGPGLGGDKFATGSGSNRFGPRPGGGDRFGAGPGGDRFGFGQGGDNFGSSPGGNKFGGDRFGSGPGGDKFKPRPGGDRFGLGPGGDRFDSGDDKFGPRSGGSRFGPGPGGDRFNSGDDKFGPRPGVDKFGPGPGGDKFNSGDNKFGSKFGPGPGGDRFNSGDDKFGSKFGPGPGGDRFNSGDDKFGLRSGDDKFGPGPGGDRFDSGDDKFGSKFGPGPGGDRFNSGDDKFGARPGGDRFGSGPGGDRFGSGPGGDRFGSGGDKFGPKPGGDRFGLGPGGANKFGPRPTGDRFGTGPDKFDLDARRGRFSEDNYDSPQDNWSGPNKKFGAMQNKGPRFGNEDRFGNQNKFGPNKDNDRFGPNQNKFAEDRFGPNKGHFGNQNKFGPKDNGRNASGYNEDDDYNQDYDYNEGYENEENYDEYDYEEIAAGFEQDAPNPNIPHDAPEEPWSAQNYPPPEAKEEEPPVEEPEEIFQPAQVIDYEHKSLKTNEPEVLIEPIYMYDYRHKPLNRIPLPQRPKWLTDIVKNIREFDPPLVRPYETQNLRRYPPPGDNWRNERYPQEKWYGGRRGYEERRPYEEPRGRNDWKKNAHEEKNYEKGGNPPPLDCGEEKISDTEWPEDDDFEEAPQPEVNFQKTEEPKKNVVLIEDILNPPGRFKRPPRVVIILRGPPGSGKTFLAKLIKDREVENGGSAPRILSLDDYFMVEQEKEVTEDGKKVKVKEMVYEYEEEMEESYRISLIKSFKKTITDGYFSFIIVDNVNDKVKYFGEMWSFAKQNGFQVYICQLDLDVQTCSKRNIHGRSEEDIEKCVSNWEPTPSHHPILDATSLLQSASIREVEMEEVNSPESDANASEGLEDQVSRSKWDNFDCSVDNLAKLDGVSKPLRHKTMEEYLQLDSQWTPVKPAKPGQKRVRWADLEEQKQQEKMRAIGFVVGHTNWNRMMDPTGGSSALTQTKYIERTGRHKVDHRRND